MPSPPAPGPDEALVHPIAVATCDLDGALALGRSPFPLPLHFGHECVADVLEVGDQVAEVSTGQRVVVPFQISCGRCPRCAAGLTGSCTAVPPISMYGFGIGGGHWAGCSPTCWPCPMPTPCGPSAVRDRPGARAASVADNVSDAYRHIAPHLPTLLERDPDAAVLLNAGATTRSLLSPSVPLYAGPSRRSH
ncbi:MAG: alcohol dehydrogenase catalytic domain-containing protein [Actinomycetota bacterium]|nr:alcohol dehydrogenase catalytic domain-containing protein [Actinomycetota bacterium]